MGPACLLPDAPWHRHGLRAVRRAEDEVEESDCVVGVLVLRVTDKGFCLDNVAVRPSATGTGVGRLLLSLAETEARRQGNKSTHLATRELMHENRALYGRIRYLEHEPRVVSGYPRVFFRKKPAQGLASSLHGRSSTVGRACTSVGWHQPPALRRKAPDGTDRDPLRL